MGSNEYDKLESALRVLLMHMLKWDHQPEKRTRSWENTIAEQRDRALAAAAQESEPQIRRSEAVTRRLQRRGRLRASGETDMDLEAFPAEAAPTTGTRS